MHNSEGLGLGPRAGQQATDLVERSYFSPQSQLYLLLLIITQVKAEYKCHCQELESQ